ncbi:MAG: hypothetical protein IKE95_09590 [Methanobrevibacter sp.]|nr:hypothetical protein [Methanobrevibacter sp.]
MIRKFEEIKNRGLYCDSGQLNDVYNRVLETNAKPTSCGSCMRGRIQQLVDALNRYEEQLKKAQDASKPIEPTVDTPEENKEPTAKKVGRPKKS